MKADERHSLKIIVLDNENFVRSMDMLSVQHKKTCARDIREPDVVCSFFKAVDLVSVYQWVDSMVKNTEQCVISETYIGPERRNLCPDVSFIGQDRRQPDLEIEENPVISISQEERDVLLAA